MTDHRFALDPTADEHAPLQATPGFMMFTVAAGVGAQASPLQSLYQQMYEQAVRAQQAPPPRDLFAVMN